jgi:uncharacterized membrane protein YeiH
MDKLALVLDLVGTFVFALSGALAGVKRRLDLFGVLVLSFAAGNSGGIARDVLIGAVPPGAINDWRYLAVSLVAGLTTFYFSPVIARMWNPVLLFDAAGLALFAVAGTSKALAYGLDPIMATALGMVTGIGGGMVRDVLLAEIPTVLRCRARGSGGRGSRAHAALATGSGDCGWIDPLLRTARDGHQARLEAAAREIR